MRGQVVTALGTGAGSTATAAERCTVRHPGAMHTNLGPRACAAAAIRDARLSVARAARQVARVIRCI
jgi:hypothetical protein